MAKSKSDPKFLETIIILLTSNIAETQAKLDTIIEVQSELIAHLTEGDPNVIWEKINDSVDEKIEKYMESFQEQYEVLRGK